MLMMETEERKALEHIYQGSISLSGFFFALFSYSFLEYKKYQGLSEFSVAMPALMSFMLALSGLLSLISFFKIKQKKINLIDGAFILLLVMVTFTPVIMWSYG